MAAPVMVPGKASKADYSLENSGKKTSNLTPTLGRENRIMLIVSKANNTQLFLSFLYLLQ